MVFKAGQSGNPKGRSSETSKVTALARTYTEDAIRVLSDLMMNGKVAPNTRVSAANSLLDRGYGKPAQTVQDDEGNVLQTMYVIHTGINRQQEVKE